MTKKELALIYLKRQGYNVIHGEGYDPIMPFIMMDVVFQYYKQLIKMVPLKNELKKYANDWYTNYRILNQSFFRTFDKDEAVEVLDIMDDFENYINNELVFAKIAAMKCFEEEDFEKREVISICTLCDIIAQLAQVIHKGVFKNRFGNGIENHNIGKIRYCARNFMSKYYKGEKIINMQQSEDLRKNVLSLCKKITKFLDE